MVECPQGSCEDMKEINKKLTNIRICVKGKVGWVQLGATIIALLGIMASVTLYGLAAEKTQNDKISDVKVVQQDVDHIKSDVKDIKHNMEKAEEERKQDLRIIHQRITNTENKILRAIEKLQK